MDFEQIRDAIEQAERDAAPHTTDVSRLSS